MRKRFVFIAAAVAALLIVASLAGCGGQSAETGAATGGNTGAVAPADTTAAATLPDTGGRMQLAETSFDFGTVPIGQKVDHAFTVKNVGNGPLQLGPLSVKRLEGC
ncbi:MAG: Ig-like domain-containing protein [Thermoleophilia bacterium]